MNIAYRIMTGQPVSEQQLKYLVWLLAIELKNFSPEEIVGLDEEECFNIDDLLDALDLQLGMVP